MLHVARVEATCTECVSDAARRHWVHGDCEQSSTGCCCHTALLRCAVLGTHLPGATTPCKATPQVRTPLLQAHRQASTGVCRSARARCEEEKNGSPMCAPWRCPTPHCNVHWMHVVPPQNPRQLTTCVRWCAPGSAVFNCLHSSQTLHAPACTEEVHEQPGMPRF